MPSRAQPRTQSPMTVRPSSRWPVPPCSTSNRWSGATSRSPPKAAPRPDMLRRAGVGALEHPAPKETQEQIRRLAPLILAKRPTAQPRRHLIRWQRARNQVTLQGINPESAQAGGCFLGLDTFGHALQLHVPSEIDGRLDDRK